jgi:hydrogen peroxide-dependent heme synthase
MPQVPLTIEGASVLHQMMRLRWSSWKQLPPDKRKQIAHDTVRVLSSMSQSAVFAMLGHKGDLMFVHFRESFEELKRVELMLAKLELWDYLEATTSYVSVIELGLYESTVKTYQTLLDKGLAPHSEEWDKQIADVIARQKDAMRPRLYPEIPPAKFICFYPMDRKRGEDKNFYTLPITDRQRQMHEHGLVGRRYAGEVKQIITGSIGFDDWEWGVDLFADDPLVFKKLIYEMRFDEVSAVYALFGQFYVGLRCLPENLPKLLEGEWA